MTSRFDLDVEAIKRSSAVHAAAIVEGRDERCLALTSIGRKSGKPRTTALIYGAEGENFIIVGSLGGAPASPQWCHNLEANPEASVHVDGIEMPVIARIAEGEERSRLWEMMVGLFPPYAEYQLKTERVIPIFVLQPNGTPRQG